MVVIGQLRAFHDQRNRCCGDYIVLLDLWLAKISPGRGGIPSRSFIYRQQLEECVGVVEKIG
jgi:hypothetical protein